MLGRQINANVSEACTEHTLLMNHNSDKIAEMGRDNRPFSYSKKESGLKDFSITFCRIYECAQL